MNLNVFNWIRDGVKQSVLLGFSDAIEEVGAPPTGEDLGPAMAAALEDSTKSKRSTNRRKRLGRSLKDLQDSPSPE